MSFQQVPCRQDNHYDMPFEYVCLEDTCLKNSKFLGCIYCCEQSHKAHIDSVKSLRVILNQILKNKPETQFNGTSILLDGINECKQQNDLKQNVSELIYFYKGLPKAQKLINQENIQQNNSFKKFYEKRPQKQKKELAKTVKKEKKKERGLCANTEFISPVLTFCEEDAGLQKYEFVSPFCIVNPAQKMTTAFAQPPLNRFQESVQTSIKIQRLTPFWLGIGISKGKINYEDQSKNHIILTSNGWINVQGELRKTKVKYCTKDTVIIKWDKQKSLIQFGCQGERETINLQLKWNQDIYLCIALFYKDDSVQLLS